MKIHSALCILSCFVTLLIPHVSHAVEVFPVAQGNRVGMATECPVLQYKQTKSFTNGLLKIPITWSYYVAGETSLATNWEDVWQSVFLSVGQDGVAFGDTNWNQVDFMKMSGSDVRTLLEDTKKAVAEANDKGFAGGGTWSVERVAGRRVDVLTYATDAGEINKFASAGKMYFLASKERYRSVDGMHTYDVGLLIHKQALGDAEFECGFQSMLKSLKMRKLLNRYFYNYPVLK